MKLICQLTKQELWQMFVFFNKIIHSFKHLNKVSENSMSDINRERFLSFLNFLSYFFRLSESLWEHFD